MKTKAITVALTLSLALAAGVAQARSAVLLLEHARVELAVGGNDNPEGVKNAIVTGGAERGWTVVTSEPGRVRLKYDKQGGKHEVVVDALYDGKGYQLKYVSSFNMKYENGPDGALIHPFYNKWVDSLMQAISRIPVKAPAQ